LAEVTRGTGGTVAIPRDGEAVTAGWLSAVLGATHRDAGRVAQVAGEPVGAGIGLLGTLHRLDLRWEDPAAGAPARLVVKLAAAGTMSRRVGIDLGMYRNEVDFYRHLATDTVLAVGCHHAAMDDATGDFVLLLDDLSAAAVLDQIEGCPPDRAATVVAGLAGHHATFWGGAGLGGHPWLRRVDDAAFVSALAAAFASAWPVVRERDGDLLPADVRATGDRFPGLLPGLAADLAAEPSTLSHGDLRLDNIFFPDDGRLTLCDWQLVDRSRGGRDLAYFMSQSLTSAHRAEHERALLAEYRGRLADHGVDYPLGDVWRDYRVATLFSFAYPVVAGAGLDLDDRAAQLARVILDRSVAALVELGCLTLRDGR
jgi:hypothetical protein